MSHQQNQEEGNKEDDQPELQQPDRQVVLPLHVLAVLQVLVNLTYHTVINHFAPLYIRTPYHTSALSGADWVQELLTGHPQRIRTELGVYRSTFIVLVLAIQALGLHSSHNVSIEEQLSIFLYSAVTGLSFPHVGDRFQRSSATVTKYFKRILRALATPPFYTTYVRLPDANSPTPPEIQASPKFDPFFGGALGAIDGTHIRCHLKRRFRILQLLPEYDMTIQALIPPALVALHNLIQQYDPEDIHTFDDDEVFGDRQESTGILGTGPVTPDEML